MPHDHEHDHAHLHDHEAEGLEWEGDPEPHIVTTTFANLEQGRTIAKLLLENQLAACVQLLPGATSFFTWEGAPKEETEVIGIIKTTDVLLPEILAVIEEHHSYETPEFLAVPVVAGSPSYIDWLLSSVRSPIEVEEEG